MKYGEQLERDSVPEWSLHNVDYNSLKHEIKVHTTKDQAVAIAIPGQADPALQKFENALFSELSHQHARVDLFVGSKASELHRRLEHLSTTINRWAIKSANDESISPLKRQRRFAKYERELLQCDTDIHSLARFCKAQVVAFRKILKKYKKWTGSTSLQGRINEDVLGHPKSFSRRDFSALQRMHDDVLDELRAAEPPLSEPSSPDSAELPEEPINGNRQTRVTFSPLPPSQLDSQQTKYWNEYDDGSEGGHDDDYAIYINPDENSTFPGLNYVTAPFEKVGKWFKSRKPVPEQTPLLIDTDNRGYQSTSAHTDSEEEGYASSDGIPSYGFSTHYAAFPSVDEQRVAKYREKVLLWSTFGCFLTSFVLLGICGVLISTGKHKLRIEVDAGVTLGVVVSLFCACLGLGMTIYRKEKSSIIFRLAVWCSFLTSCTLNGMLLVLVVANSP